MFLSALTIRLLYLADYYGTPFFLAPMWDSAEYASMAEVFARGAIDDTFGYRPPLYPIFLGMVNLITGSILMAPRILQILFGSYAVLICYRIARRLYGERAGVLAALLTAYSGLMIFFDLELLPTSLFTLTLLLFLEQMVRLNDNGNLMIAGLWLGIASLIWPVVLPFGAMAMLWIARTKRVSTLHTTTASGNALRFFAGWAFLPLLSLIIHLLAGQGAVVVSSNGGVNFYIGNHRTADGTSVTLPEVGESWLWNQMEEEVEDSIGGEVGSSAVDRHYWAKGIREITSDPVGWLRLMGKKLLLFWSYRTITSDQDIGFHLSLFPWLKILSFIGFPLMVIPALWGLLTGIRVREIRLIGLFILTFSILVIFFFVNARFRHPLTPILIILAVGGVSTLYGAIKQNGWVRVLRSGSVITGVVVGVVLLFAGGASGGMKHAHYPYFAYGVALERVGRLVEADSLFALAISKDSTAPFISFKRGELAVRMELYRDAIPQYERELKLQPHYAKGWNNLGIVQLNVGRPLEAIRSFETAMDSDPKLITARRNLLRALDEIARERAGENDWITAQPLFQKASGLDPTNPFYPTMSLKGRYILQDRIGIHSDLDSLLRRFPDYLPARQLKESWKR